MVLGRDSITDSSKPEEFRVRAAAKEDLPRILQVDQLGFADGCGYNWLALRQIYDAAPDYLLIAEALAGKDLAGYIAGLPGLDPAELWIVSVVVHPARRGGPIFLSLCSALRQKAVARGVARAFLTVKPDNQAVLRMAERFGFRAVQREADYFGPGEERLLLEWTVEHD